MRDCGELRVVDEGAMQFSCDVCGVWVTGWNPNGGLGTGDRTDVTSYTNVSALCFELI